MIEPPGSGDQMAFALKCLVSYIYLIVLLRILGKKEFSQLSVYDFVVYLLMADIMVMGFEDNFFESILGTSVLVIVDSFSSYLSLKSKKMRDLIEGKPSFIIRHGKLNIKEMKKCRYSCDSLAQHLRQKGISSLSEVEFALLENNGQLSVIKTCDNVALEIEPVIMDGRLMEAVLKRNGYEKKWLLKEIHPCSVEEIMYAVIEKDGLYFVKK